MLQDLLPETLKNQLFVSAWSLKNVPLIFWCRPRIKELSARSTKIVIPLNRRTKNHLNSMYFGVLAVGADCAGGLMAMKIIKESGKNVSFAFKDFQANFIKRADSDTVFECLDGEGVMNFMDKVLESGERMEYPVKVIATCPATQGDQHVAEFTLTISCRRK